MNPEWSNLTAFGLIGFVSLLLPLIPAVRTLKRTPNRAPPQDTPISSHSQCETFRHLVNRQFGHLLAVARTKGSIHGETESRRPYIVLGMNSHLAGEIPQGVQRLRSMIIAAGHLDIPGEIVCDREIFAEGKVNIGHSTMVRTVLSPRDIAINTKARVSRWVRSDRRIDVAEGACVKGWTSAGVEISLARRARFEQLSAPMISFGRHSSKAAGETEIIGRFTQEPSSGPSQRTVTVPDNHVVKNELIATDKLTIGAECRVLGDLRGGSHILIGGYSIIEGAVFCDGTITIQEGCRLSGPVVAKGGIHLHTNCQIGSEDRPTTLTAPHIRIAEGCTAYGTVWATTRGEVFFQE